ncbi:aminodeoxychorismate lyase [Psychromonas sp. SP041]|uniref:aminodeoxychorismate lyase n=1 Tax=Psychromonas sp. SP041 TaxID=1365007 RepID=UPI0004264749|nr:aminodeoxychorismate lyase [Psychromonas sp. SP041]
MLINGLENNKINAADRGLAYGDGLFSTIKIECGDVIDWPLHLERLQQGAVRLFFPDIDWQQLQQEVFTAASSVLGQPHYVLKLMLTRGSGGRGYSAEGCNDVQRIISLSAFPDVYLQWQQQGINIVQCASQLARNKQLAGLKSLARLEQVFIKQELATLNAVEGLVCDEFGNVIEACSANVFIYLHDQWITPKLDFCGVAGVMRARIMKHSAINVVEKEISLEDVNQASCLFLSNALMGIVPVKQYQQKKYSQQQLQRITELQIILKQGSLQQ